MLDKFGNKIQETDVVIITISEETVPELRVGKYAYLPEHSEFGFAYKNDFPKEDTEHHIRQSEILECRIYGNEIEYPGLLESMNRKRLVDVEYNFVYGYHMLSCPECETALRTTKYSVPVRCANCGQSLDMSSTWDLDTLTP